MTDNKSVPYIVFESALARQERTISRLWIVIIVLCLLLVGTNSAWTVHNVNKGAQYEWMETEKTNKTE